jgi:hypothetical protein
LSIGVCCSTMFTVELASVFVPIRHGSRLTGLDGTTELARVDRGPLDELGQGTELDGANVLELRGGRQ